MDTIDSRIQLLEEPIIHKSSRRDFLRCVGAGVAAGLAPLIPNSNSDAEELEEPQRSRTRLPTSNTSSVDSMLESRMDAFIKDLRRAGHLNSTDGISVTVYDIDHGRKFVSIDEDVRRMAASTIKDYVMLAMFKQIENKKLNYTPKIKRLLQMSIQHSNNSATNGLIKILGGPSQVNNILSKDFSFFKETRIVEYIPNGGRTYRNTISTHDLSIFYNQLWAGNLPYANEMKRYLSLPKRDRLFDGTCIPSGTRVLNKTGTVYGLVADSGILVMKDDKGKTYPYIINVIIEDKTKPHSKDRNGSAGWIKYRSNLIRELSEGAYDYLFQFHTGKPYICKQHNGRHLGGRQ